MSDLKVPAEFNEFKDVAIGFDPSIVLNSRVDRFLLSEEGQRFKMLYEPKSRVTNKGVIIVRWVRRTKYLNFQFKGFLHEVNPLNNRQRNEVIKYLRFGDLPPDISRVKVRPRDKAIRYGEADNPGPRRNRARGRRFRRSFPRSLQSTVSTVPIRGLPFNIFGSTSAPISGGLNTEESGNSLTNATSVILDPFAIGGRFNIIAQEYLQYRIKSGVFRYRSQLSVSGVQENTGSGITAPVYSNRTFVYGVSRDADFVPSSFDNAVNYGGRHTEVTKNTSIPIAPTGWKYTDTPASPTASDIRLCCFGALFFWFKNGTSAATTIYGQIEFDGVVQFRGAKNNVQVASTAVERYSKQNKERYEFLGQPESKEATSSQRRFRGREL